MRDSTNQSHRPVSVKLKQCEHTGAYSTAVALSSESRVEQVAVLAFLDNNNRNELVVRLVQVSLQQFLQ